MNHEALRAKIRDVPDFPEPGILFKDITPLLADPGALDAAVRGIADLYRGDRVECVVGIESRGFIFGTAVALELGCGFAPARKAGKLPWQTHKASYALEYGTAEVEMHRDAVCAGQRVLIVDDLIATGGTAAAVTTLIERMGAEVLGAAFLIELDFLDGRKQLGVARIDALLHY